MKRFIFSSSCSIYGLSNETIVDENSLTNPLTAYAQSKIKSEQALLQLSTDTFCVTILRNATVYGFSPSFRNDLVVNNFVTCAYALHEILIESDGSPWRPLIEVRDLAQIFVEFLQLPQTRINGKVINIGFSENNFQINELIKFITTAFPHLTITYTGAQPDSRSYKVSFSLFEKLRPAFKQQWDLEKSIHDMVEKLAIINYTKDDFLLKKYARIALIKRLLKEKQVTKKLFWKSKYV